MKWILDLFFGSITEAAISWVADSVYEAMKRQDMFGEADEYGDEMAERIKGAKTEDEKRRAARDLADNSF